MKRCLYFIVCSVWSLIYFTKFHITKNIKNIFQSRIKKKNDRQMKKSNLENEDSQRIENKVPKGTDNSNIGGTKATDLVEELKRIKVKNALLSIGKGTSINTTVYDLMNKLLTLQCGQLYTFKGRSNKKPSFEILKLTSIICGKYYCNSILSTFIEFQ